MAAFTYEEQGDRRYLVYEKKPEDTLDTLTLEMISNNQIQGLAPANHIQIDDSFYMKYDITGCKSLREYMQGTINRQQLLYIMESVADAAMEAEDYMLRFSSYVLDMDYMYIDGAGRNVFCIVLPVVREEAPLELFLKELLMRAQYNQAEDCSYVAALINFFSSPGSFSVHALKEKTAGLKKEKIGQKKIEEHKSTLPDQLGSLERRGHGKERYGGKKYGSEPYPSKTYENNKYGHERPGADLINGKTPNDPEKQSCLDILFSDEEEKTFREKIGQFFKRGRSEKDGYEEDEIEDGKEKRGFFAKKSEKKKKDQMKGQTGDSILNGIEIPGMEMPVRPQKDSCPEDREQKPQYKYEKRETPIPVQKIPLKQLEADGRNFGETEYLQEEDDDETAFLGQESGRIPEFSLYRFNTKETFRITGDVSRIGRSPSIAEICITGNKCVGRIHAILYIRGQDVFIEDNHSKNYTYVDGIRLDPEEPPVLLNQGSKIRLGDEELEFIIEEQ